MQVWTAGPEDEGRSLRDVLLNSMRLSWSLLKSAKWNGQILRNGEPAFMRDRVRPGDRIQVIPPKKKPFYIPAPCGTELDIPYEDAFLLVVNKPSGLASQSSARQPDNSLENALYSFLGCPEDFIYRPVNRLDKGTGGLMAVARDGHTQDLMQRQLHSPDFVREYLALAEGVPSPREGAVDLPIAKAGAATVRREVRPDGKPARTLYRVLAVQEGDRFVSAGAEEGLPRVFSCPCSPPGSPARSLIRLRLETGRTHQIRVHLAALGCPVCGDFLYGRELPEEFPGGFALHSAFLRLRHPITGETLSFTSLPAWLRAEA